MELHKTNRETQAFCSEQLDPSSTGGSRLWGPAPYFRHKAFCFQMRPRSVPGSPRKTSSASRQQPQLCKRESWAGMSVGEAGAASCCSGACASHCAYTHPAFCCLSAGSVAQLACSLLRTGSCHFVLPCLHAPHCMPHTAASSYSVSLGDPWGATHVAGPPAPICYSRNSPMHCWLRADPSTVVPRTNFMVGSLGPQCQSQGWLAGGLGCQWRNSLEGGRGAMVHCVFSLTLPLPATPPASRKYHIRLPA